MNDPAEAYPSGWVDLPEPLADFIGPPGGDDPGLEQTFFNPEGWDAEILRTPREDDRDPVEHDLGRCEGNGTAALFVSDFHMADGSAGGDDFLHSHLLADDRTGLHGGSSPAGESRAKLFSQVLTFALARVARQLGPKAQLDVVLNGDVINFLELKGRGSTPLSRKHLPFFRTLFAARTLADVYWLRGNHDYVVPSGPWKAGEFYVNRGITTLAEHGDFWDPQNWPPGPGNKGSRLVIEAGGAFEVHAGVIHDGAIKYLMSGVDNLRPWNNVAAKKFLDRRGAWSDIALIAALLVRLESVGTADDSAAFKGACSRRQGRFENWLMVQGHTHVPAAVPGVYYNTGAWIDTLVDLEGEESLVEDYPFLLVYRGADGRRVEEYYTAGYVAPGAFPRVRMEDQATVNARRVSYGYQPI